MPAGAAGAAPRIGVVGAARLRPAAVRGRGLALGLDAAAGPAGGVPAAGGLGVCPLAAARPGAADRPHRAGPVPARWHAGHRGAGALHAAADRGLGGGVGGVRALLAAKGADLMRKVGLGDAIREVGGGHNPGSILLAVFDGAICWGIVGEADLVGFVNVEHVDLVVPAPGVNFSSKILVQDAWAVLLEDSHHGRATRATIQPYSQRRILSADARFEEPEEATSTSVSSFTKPNCSKLVNLRVDVVVLLLALLIIEETAG